MSLGCFRICGSFPRRKQAVLHEQSTLKDVARRWAATQPTAASFISLLVSDFHDGQDILQEVAAAVLSYDFETHGWPKVFDAWVIGIARHKVMDYYRKRGTDKLVFDSESIDRIAEAHERVGDQMPLRREALEKCLGRVPGKSRRLLEMRYQLGMEPKDIGPRVGMAAGAVRVSLLRIRMALRGCIEARLGRQGVWR
ncbi:MAG: sigma-70 family RNA polymerase sigma factor [Phycisphaerae bacterium]